MLTLRKADARGHADHGWLDSHHTFSFADYYDPRFMGFRALRVINDDTVSPGGGFGTHGHRDMEIISYVLEGGLKHADSMGTGSVIRPGDVQCMSAGTGVRHSEFNASREERVHFLQIWLMPDEQGVKPSYQQRAFTEEEKRGKLRLVASPDGGGESLKIHTDARVYVALLRAGERVEHAVQKGRGAWVHVARGALTVDGVRLNAGDGASTEEPGVLKLEGVEGSEEAEVLLFDLA